MKQVLKGFYGHDILLIIEIVLDAAAWHSAWGKISTPQNCPSNVADAFLVPRERYFWITARRAAGTKAVGSRMACRSWNMGGSAMRGILLWLIGVPIPIIILLYLFDVI
jgi:hypothetical protein